MFLYYSVILISVCMGNEIKLLSISNIAVGKWIKVQWNPDLSKLSLALPLSDRIVNRKKQQLRCGLFFRVKKVHISLLRIIFALWQKLSFRFTVDAMKLKIWLDFRDDVGLSITIFFKNLRTIKNRNPNFCVVFSTKWVVLLTLATMLAVL